MSLNANNHTQTMKKLFLTILGLILLVGCEPNLTKTKSIVVNLLQYR